MKIFIVIGHIDYEGDTNIKAFKKDEDAKVFLKKCEDYYNLHPNNIGKGDIDKWAKEHPAKSTIHDDYGIQEMEVEE